MPSEARRPPTLVTISALTHYPIKGCRGIDVERAELDARGLKWDRHWMIVDEAGHFVTQRTRPVLATIVPRIDGESLVLSVGADASSGASAATTDVDAAASRAPHRAVASRSPASIRVPLVRDTDGPLFDGAPSRAREVTVWRSKCRALDEGDEVAAWLSAIVGQPVRLVRQAPDDRRAANHDYTGDVHAPVAFSDGYPILVANSTSLAWLNERLPEPLPMNRFRPNVVIDGMEAWEEDRVDTLVMGGGAVLKLVKPCTRCIVTTTDQLTGARTSDDPLPLLKQHRWDRELRGVTFGVNAVILTAAPLQRGDILSHRSKVS